MHNERIAELLRGILFLEEQIDELEKSLVEAMLNSSARALLSDIRNKVFVIQEIEQEKARRREKIHLIASEKDSKERMLRMQRENLRIEKTDLGKGLQEAADADLAFFRMIQALQTRTWSRKAWHRDWWNLAETDRLSREREREGLIRMAREAAARRGQRPWPPSWWSSVHAEGIMKEMAARARETAAKAKETTAKAE